MSDNWVVGNLQNALDTWNAKVTELWSLILTDPKNFKGGGIWTALALTLVFTIGWEKVFMISGIFYVFWLIVMYVLIKRNRKTC